MHRDVMRFTCLVLSVSAAACDSSSADQPLFTLLPSSETGITFANRLPENPSRNGFTYEYYYNGSGVAVGDLNGDSLPDLYFTANADSNRLYLNRGGFKFEDVTAAAGVGGRRAWATGVTLADVNADGRLDIYVSYSGPYSDPELRRNMLYINEGVRDGVPVFSDQAGPYRLDDPGYSTQAAFFDYDRDGDLDAYVMNHGIPGYRSLPELRAGRSQYEIDHLYRNDGSRFADVTDAAGLIDTNLGFGLGLSVADLNNDGWPDLYIANDFSGRDYLYLNQKNGRFLEVLEQSMAHTPLASMGSDIADIDGDGWLDLAVLEMAMETHYDRQIAENGMEADRFAQQLREQQHFQYATNSLQWNRGVNDRGVPIFSDIANLAGVARTDWSWAALLADFDNDGRADLFASTGMAGGSMDADFQEYMQRRVAEVRAQEGRPTHSLMLELLQKLPRRKVANQLYRNEGDLTFRKATRAPDWGLTETAYSYGSVYSDLDRDGDLDLVVNNLMGEASVYRNSARDAGDSHYIAIRLKGAARNPFGVGARVRVSAGGIRQLQELHLTRGYQSSVEPVLHFGLAANTRVDTIEVFWSDGAYQTTIGTSADQYITLDRSNAEPNGPAPRALQPLFRKSTSAMAPVPRHDAVVFALDTALRPYPSKRDEIGIAAGDLNGDGQEDFVFGSKPARVYIQSDGSFRGTVLTIEEARAVASFDMDGDRDRDIWLVLGTGRHEQWLNDGSASFTRAKQQPSAAYDAAAVLAPADYDRDGDIDLFVGSFSSPGTKNAAGSRLLRNQNGAFEDVTSAVAPALATLSTITSAKWADLDGNGTPDLIVAGEWMPVAILLNDGNRLRDATAEAQVSESKGWWQSLAVADLDRDGDTDIAAGNFGLNYPFAVSTKEPFELFSADFDGDGDAELVSAYQQGGRQYPLAGRRQLAAQIPSISTRYTTNDAFARAALPDLLGAERVRAATRFAVTTLASTWFENLGNGQFRAHSLPRAAQVSAITAIVADDFDRDGHTDLLLGGNFYELDPSVPRADAGVGLLLRGNGQRGFTPVMPAESGLLLNGPLRRLALIRGNGRLGLVAGFTSGDAQYWEIRR